MKYKFYILILGFLCAVGMIVPSISFGKILGTQNGVCMRLPTLEENINTDISTRENTYIQQKTKRLSNLSETWSSLDSSITASRSTSDATLQTEYTNLEAQAKTADQKTAVTNFEASVTSAVSTRRTSTDAALQTYESAVSGLISGTSNQTDAGIALFKSQIQTAFSSAQSTCTIGTSQNSIKTNLRNEIALARQTLKQQLSQNGIKKQADGFLLSRNQAVDNATMIFNTTLANAQNTLKAAFKK